MRPLWCQTGARGVGWQTDKGLHVLRGRARSYQGPRLPVMAARRMRWEMVRAVIEGCAWWAWWCGGRRSSAMLGRGGAEAVC
jgi:hypothetical protein